MRPSATHTSSRRSGIFRNIAFLSLLSLLNGTGCRENINDDSVSIIQTVLVSTNSAGEIGNKTVEAGPASVSADGRYVAFASDSTNLDPEDTDDRMDIFVRDTLTGTTELVSRSDGTTGPDATFDCGAPGISPDGRWVIFHSEANNLVDGFTTKRFRIYLRDRINHKIYMVSRTSSGGDISADCKNPSMAVIGTGETPDIRVVFETAMNGITVGDNNGIQDVFVALDVLSKVFSGNYLVSRRTGSNTPRLDELTECHSFDQDTHSKSGVISANGNYVLFLSNHHKLAYDYGSTAWSNCLEPNFSTDPNISKNEYALYLRELSGNHYTLPVSLGYGDHEENSNCFQPASNPSISSDGSVTAFETIRHLRETDVPIVAPNPSTNSDVYVRVVNLNQMVKWDIHYTYLISQHTSGADSTGESKNAFLSLDGKYVVFESDWSGFANDDQNGASDIFIRNRVKSTTERVSLGTFRTEPNSGSAYPSLSENNRFVAFQTVSPNLTDNDSNGAADLFLRGPLD